MKLNRRRGGKIPDHFLSHGETAKSYDKRPKPATSFTHSADGQVPNKQEHTQAQWQATRPNNLSWKRGRGQCHQRNDDRHV